MATCHKALAFGHCQSFALHFRYCKWPEKLLAHLAILLTNWWVFTVYRCKSKPTFNTTSVPNIITWAFTSIAWSIVYTCSTIEARWTSTWSILERNYLVLKLSISSQSIFREKNYQIIGILIAKLVEDFGWQVLL